MGQVVGVHELRGYPANLIRNLVTDAPVEKAGLPHPLLQSLAVTNNNDLAVVLDAMDSMLYVELSQADLRGHIVEVVKVDVLHDVIAKTLNEGGVKDAPLVSDVLAWVGDREVLVEPLSWTVARELLEEAIHCAGELLPVLIEPRYVAARLRRHLALREPAHVAVEHVEHRTALAIGRPPGKEPFPSLARQHTL